MTASVLLCADSESVLRPELIGLSGERLDAQDWLSVFAEGLHARAFFKKNDKPTEAWVVSSDDVDSINLAAALKRDAPRHRVFLVAFRSSGSLKSRVSAAGIDGLLDRAQFVERYRSCKLGARPSRTHTTSPKAAPARPSGASSVPGADSEFLRGLDLGGSSSKQASVPQADVLTARDAPAHLSASTACQVSGRGASGEGRQAFVLVVASASGGSGKSTVAALAAVFAQGMGHRTLLMDADLQFGDASAMVGAKDPRALDEVVDGAPLPSPEEGDLPAVLAAPARLEDSERLASALPGIVDRAGASFDVIVVNTGPFWGEQHAVLVERASRVLFLIDQRSSSLQASKHALELCGRCGIPTTPFLYVVNRCKRGAPLSSIDASCALKGASVAELKDGGRAVDELMAAGMPLDLVRDENPLCVSLENLLADILPETREDRRPPAHAVRFDDIPGKRHGALARLRRRASCLC